MERVEGELEQALRELAEEKQKTASAQEEASQPTEVDTETETQA